MLRDFNVSLDAEGNPVTGDNGKPRKEYCTKCDKTVTASESLAGRCSGPFEGGECGNTGEGWKKGRRARAKQAELREPSESPESDRRRLASANASARPSEHALERRRLLNLPKSHVVVL